LLPVEWFGFRMIANNQYYVPGLDSSLLQGRWACVWATTGREPKLTGMVPAHADLRMH